ncbi:MAG TPA: ATP-binding protein [Acidobacteriaceae bacterium]|nr:ATP-binding protein [Acidobacteriaceae bacterium]
MRSFFLQIFLSFWLGTVGTFIVAISFAPRNDPGSPEQLRLALATTVTKLAQPSLEDYQARGCAGIAWLSPQISLANGAGEPLCGPPLSDKVVALLADARQSNRALFQRDGDRMMQVSPFISAQGQRYFLVQQLPYVPRPWWPHLPPAAIPVSLLVTFFFAWLLTRPVRALSFAMRRFSAGDMDVRLPISPSRWKDLGGADIRTLMLDFNHMAGRIKELVEAQKLLVRDISHELRSPLARLQVALEIAREESPASTEILDQASAEADRVNALISELLTLSLMESMRQAPAPETFSLGEIFETLLPDMRFEAEANEASVHYHSTCEECILHGQPEMLRRALENVIRNAIRYTPAGEAVEITVSPSSDATNITQSSAEETHLQISIEDRGPGVPEEHLSEIFKPFFRVDMAREGTTGGFGVGLAIAERAIYLHAGAIRVRNREGGGLTVVVSLPGTVATT